MIYTKHIPPSAHRIGEKLTVDFPLYASAARQWGELWLAGKITVNKDLRQTGMGAAGVAEEISHLGMATPGTALIARVIGADPMFTPLELMRIHMRSSCN